MWRGVELERIITVNCPENKRGHLLERYLNVVRNIYI